MQDDGSRRAVRRGTVRRVADFARPHARTIALFLGLATIAAVLGVAAPLLAGEAVDAIVEEEETRTVVLVAVLIGVVAIVEAGVCLVGGLQSLRLGETQIGSADCSERERPDGLISGRAGELKKKS